MAFYPRHSPMDKATRGMRQYDLVVIGSGPAGEKAAVHAAYHGYRVAVVEKLSNLGGAGVNTGTLPSKTLKETALYLSGAQERRLYSVERKLSRSPDAADFLFRERYVVKTEREELRMELLKRKVDVYFGLGRFLDPHRIEVGGEQSQVLYGDKILIATGSYPAHPPGIPFNGRIRDSDTILQIDRIPRSLCIVGAGVVGCEYATIFAEMDCKVTLVNSHKDILPFLDREIAGALVDQMRECGIEILAETKIESATVEKRDGKEFVRAHRADGGWIEAEMFLYASGRNGNTTDLDCARAGLKLAGRETLEVDETYRTAVPHIYAAGDVIGFPALGSTSMDQGRVAVTHMFGLHDVERVAKQFPFGIYTIPEVSMIGLTEETARKKGIDYAVGRAFYKDIPRGLIVGAEHGFLKMIVNRRNRMVLGVHIFGTHATELVHYGMELVENEESLGRVLGTVFNFPTLHELYKYAAYEIWTGELDDRAREVAPRESDHQAASDKEHK
ncbi:MAG: Si-specific NAD(P)(+) transhydrogenase [Candidatus Omnitrophica bacterium]|nr:Si-specific NAD(P)(+) transhydrogenase [Candidatus Omnitrophota bacterium]